MSTPWLEFAGGATVAMTYSFDSYESQVPHLELYGTEGTLLLPDPNMFWGAVVVCRADGTRGELPPVSSSVDNVRGLGVKQMAVSLSAGRTSRLSARVASHVLESMEAILEASRRGKWCELKSFVEKPNPFGSEKRQVHSSDITNGRTLGSRGANNRCDGQTPRFSPLAGWNHQTRTPYILAMYTPRAGYFTYIATDLGPGGVATRVCKPSSEHVELRMIGHGLSRFGSTVRPAPPM